MVNPGLSPEVQEALQRRSMGSAGTPQLAQTSPGAPMQDQSAAPVSVQPSQMQGVPATPQTGNAPTSENEMIIKALTDKLKANTKAQDQATQAPAAPAAPDMIPPAMGGGGYSERVDNFSTSPISPIPTIEQLKGM